MYNPRMNLLMCPGMYMKDCLVPVKEDSVTVVFIPVLNEEIGSRVPGFSSRLERVACVGEEAEFVEAVALPVIARVWALNSVLIADHPARGYHANVSKLTS